MMNLREMERMRRMKDEGDSEDPSWFWLWKCLEYLFDFNSKTLSDSHVIQMAQLLTKFDT
jgi:hypothetical protein